MPAAPYDAIVLAGGRSSRMGDVDKLGVVVDGRTLLSHACEAVAGARRFVVVGPERLPGVPGSALTTREVPAYSGPVAAIGAGLAALGADRAGAVVVVAADVPRAAEAVPELVDALHRHPDADGVVPLSGGRRQPLLAIYRTALLVQVLAAAEPLADRSVTSVVNTMDLHEIELPADVVADVDTPADLSRLTEETDRG